MNDGTEYIFFMLLAPAFVWVVEVIRLNVIELLNLFS